MTGSGAGKTVLVLQGGGALGSYQGGVYQALSENGVAVEWVGGISIGAINAAIIAGNPPDARVKELHNFWEHVSSGVIVEDLINDALPHGWANNAAAAYIATFGVPGFFNPRLVSPQFHPPGSPAALSYYDTGPLRETLLAHVDFDRINAGETRLSVSAVNVKSGNFVNFDSAHQKIGPEHIMASGALPPGFAPIEIDGEFYWDGGLVSNTPLDYVTSEFGGSDDTTVFQVDLFSARGPMPGTMIDAGERAKDIRFSSRTRFITDMVRYDCTQGNALRNLLAKLPDELQDDPDAQYLAKHMGRQASLTIAHLIYRGKLTETRSKDYLFTRRSVREHWAAGLHDAVTTLNHPDWLNRARGAPGVAVFDLARDAPPVPTE